MAATVTFEMQLLPERLDDAPAAIAETLIATRDFAGNLGVLVLQDADDPTHVTLLESWESLDHHVAYAAWRATPDGRSPLRDIIATSPVTTRYEHLGV